MTSCPTVTPPPLEPPMLGGSEDDDDTDKSAQEAPADSGSFTKRASDPKVSSLFNLAKALDHHHEVMVTWMARVEKQLAVLQAKADSGFERVAEVVSSAPLRRISRPKLTTSSNGSRSSPIDELENKILEQMAKSTELGEQSRSLGELREAQNAAKKAFRQDISCQIPIPSQSSSRKASQKKGREREQAENSMERSVQGEGTVSDEQVTALAVPIPDLPGASPVFCAHSSEKPRSSSVDRQFDSVLSQPNMSPVQSLKVVSCASMPDRSTEGMSRSSSSARMIRNLPQQLAKDPQPTDPSTVQTSPSRLHAGEVGRGVGEVGREVSHKSSASVPSSQSQEDDSVWKVRSRRKSLEVRKVVSSGNLTEVFKQRERALTAQLSPHNEDMWAVQEASARLEFWDAKRREEDSLSVSSSASWWLMLRPLDKFVSRSLSKFLGLLPIVAITDTTQEDKSDFDSEGSTPARACCVRERVLHCVGAAYHFFIVALVFAFMAGTFIRVGHCDTLDAGFCVVDLDWPGMASDIAIAAGALAMLLCWGGMNYKEQTRLMSGSMQDLVDALQKKSLDKAFEVWSCSDSLMAVLFWAVALGGRWTLVAMRMADESCNSKDPVGRYLMILQELLYFISSGVIVITSFWQVRTSHAMTLIVNAWVEPFLNNEVSCDHLRSEWRTVSGLFRKTSRTFQHCCATMGFTSILLILSVLYDFRRGNAIQALPNAVLGLCLPGVLVIHASTTTACKRLPSLVMLWEPSEGSNERDYMDLALFLSMSECGFFIWDTCLTLGLVQKFIYFTVAMAGTLGFQSGVLKLSDLP